MVARYRKLVSEGQKLLASQAMVDEARRALQALLVNGRITLSPSAQSTRAQGRWKVGTVEGKVHFKRLYDFS
jgi:hypothetical protein